ncbi:hypothetical protein RQN30_11040 [Arcanobacterium hippocoleae]
MVSQEGGNVRVYGIDGNFDDAQSGVKQIFASRVREQSVQDNCENSSTDLPFKLSSANSINIGRLVPQIMYYFTAYRDLLRAGKIVLGDIVDFSVPTGNFGDILAGYLAKRLGLPVGKLICASNANNVLTDFLRTGIYDRRRRLHKTISPSMDILVSSNLERMLYFLCEDSTQVRKWMEELQNDGKYELPADLLARLQEHFWAGYCTDEAAQETIARVWKETGYLCDPHTAAGWKAAVDYTRETAGDREYTGTDSVQKSADSAQDGRKRVMVVLSTASPYKFPRAVLTALGAAPIGDDFALLAQLEALTGVPVPKNLSALAGKTELHPDVIAKEQMREAALMP